jgi:hypothetical protein
MKLLLRNTILAAAFFAVTATASAQDDTTKGEPAVGLRYFMQNNSLQWLRVKTSLRKGNKPQLLPNQVVKIFLDSAKPENLIGKIYTNEQGDGKAVIPAGLKDQWSQQSTHRFIAVLEATSVEDERSAEIDVTRGKIEFDTSTLDGVKTVNLLVSKFENNTWVPAKDVELKVGIRRLGGELKIGEDESYTTDSLGQATAEFKLDSLPGDLSGNIVLVAKTEDNDQLGNLSVEKTVPWGRSFSPVSHFGQRSLSAARGRSPIWLALMAYSIIGGVWGTILYLVIQIIKIKKLGTRNQDFKEELIPANTRLPVKGEHSL